MGGNDESVAQASNASPTLRFRRVLLKLSGEALMGDSRFGIDTNVLSAVADELREVHALGVQLALVIGGGNIFRGIAGATEGMDRAHADYMGMVATVINALALQDALERLSVPTRVMSAIEMHQVAEPYIRRRAARHLDKGRIIIFAAGTGNPFFTTDTAASLRAAEIGAEVMLKATKVDGIFDADPKIYGEARQFQDISYFDFLNRGLKVMDATAISLCMETKLPIIVFNLTKRGNIKRVLCGESIGTIVH